MSAKELLNNPKKLEEISKSAFKDLDEDNNGYIDFDELSQALSDLSEEEIKTILKELDSDKSGKVSYAEFKQNIKKIIEQLI